uniref:Reverse transcriptase N-terminal domain-containing protein n=2 Tax=Kappaphycus TaxID=38543 RepID=A0A8E7UEN1_9FLOR|nr:hypothetical protein [Kappaphycus striatus]
MTVFKLKTWRSLPWHKINNRVFALQEKIYKFSEQCNQESVYKLQDYMLNSSDMQLFAIQHMYSKIKQYYILRNKERYNLEDYDKRNIYNSLISCRKDYRKNQVIVKNIKQYLVYLCLKPEWEARFEPMYKFNVNDQKKYHFLYKLSNFLLPHTSYSKKSLSIQNYSLSSQRINKYIDISNIASRIQTLPSISYHIDFWLKRQDLIENLCISKNIYITLKTEIDYLGNLLYGVVCNGFEWYSMTALYQQCRTRKLFNSLHLLSNKSRTLEILTKYVFHSTISLKNIRSLYDIVRYYNCNSNYISIYAKQKAKDFHIFCSIKTKSYNVLAVQVNVIVYKHFIEYIKRFLYHYDSISRLRINIISKSYNIMIKIYNLILDFHRCNYPLINLSNIDPVFKLSDNMIIKGLKKNNKSRLSIYTRSKYLSQKISFIISNSFL